MTDESTTEPNPCGKGPEEPTVPCPPNIRKVVVVGCGFVGAASAYTLMLSGLFNEMVLIDVDRKRAEGEALDISHGISFASPCDIYAGTYDDIVDASLIVITAGANQKPGETRIDLVHKNAAILKSILHEIRIRNYAGLLLIVANPVDILTHVAVQCSGLPENHVLGSGTVLDTARLKQMIGDSLGVDPRNVHAHILGEHGDSELISWSNAHVAGIPLEDFFAMRDGGNYSKFKDEIGSAVRNSAYEIIQRKGATYYGIALAVKRICTAIVRDEKSVLPVSNLMTGNYGISGVTFSTPCIVGSSGIEGRVPAELNYSERKALQESAAVLKDVIGQLDLSCED